MEEPEVLIRHAAAWAAGKSRGLDPDTLAQALELRRHNDDLEDGSWPPGSAERLLLVTWPAYGSTLPAIESVRETLDTFWSFLRATGRMSSASASPAELRKELKRSLPKMSTAYDDPARHSQGRVLADFGRGIGIDLNDLVDADELQARLDQLMSAWNSLPQDERIRRMPDPSPKSLRGAELTASFPGQPGRPYPEWPEQEQGEEDDDDFEPGDVRLSAQAARDATFVRQCLALADWVDSRREVTTRGLLRPPVARSAYQHLDLWPWERALEEAARSSYGLPQRPSSPEVDAVMADAALNSWHSAGDCLALDRLWYSCDSADLVEIGSQRAVRSPKSPTTDEAWRDLALVLLSGLCLRLGWHTVEPLTGLLLIPAVSEDAVPLDAVRAWWDSRCPEALRDIEAMNWQGRLDLALFHFDDTGLWNTRADQLHLSDLGRDFAIVFTSLVDSGMLET